MQTSPDELHPDREARYWHNQGFEYLDGINKPYSLEDAKRCFLKACLRNDRIAASNLLLLQKDGIISLNDDEQQLFDRYQIILKPSIEDSDISTDQEKAASLRKGIEKLLYMVYGTKLNSTYLNENKKGIDMLFTDAYISLNEKDILHQIRIWSNNELHYNPDDCKYEYDEKWFDELNIITSNVEKMIKK